MFLPQVYCSTRPLRIGYYETDGATMATPSMRRAVLQTKDLLERAGHELVPFTPPSVESALFELAMRGLSADGGSTFLDNFEGDGVDANLQTLVTTFRLPSGLKSLLSVLVRPLVSGGTGAAVAGGRSSIIYPLSPQFPRLSLVLQNTQAMR
ncbi:hypothetical protein GDO78_020684 [Eleutherodactylus coqui]|uniref:Amidase domain-containing protein n=1 Tax=Eleutherodactylus coqui TaxID=57060 RepID=A0A8J6E5B9_ELECQ|nr:hypothetical protein GDO78_020684 [Eleutherodactylus coqui]